MLPVRGVQAVGLQASPSKWGRLSSSSPPRKTPAIQIQIAQITGYSFKRFQNHILKDLKDPNYIDPDWIKTHSVRSVHLEARVAPVLVHGWKSISSKSIFSSKSSKWSPIIIIVINHHGVDCPHLLLEEHVPLHREQPSFQSRRKRSSRRLARLCGSTSCRCRKCFSPRTACIRAW